MQLSPPTQTLVWRLQKETESELGSQNPCVSHTHVGPIQSTTSSKMVVWQVTEIGLDPHGHWTYADRRPCSDQGAGEQIVPSFNSCARVRAKVAGPGSAQIEWRPHDHAHKRHTPNTLQTQPPTSAKDYDADIHKITATPTSPKT